MKTDVRLEDMLPIAKLTNGFSGTLFAKRGSPLTTWADLAAAKTPLKLSSPPRQTAAYIAVLMMQREGALSTEAVMRVTLGEVIDDVTAGRSALGIASTSTVAKHLDQLQPIVSFGAQRNMMLSATPTFAEVTGNAKLAFTESIGVFASPKLDPALAARLTKAFMAAGNDMDVQGIGGGGEHSARGQRAGGPGGDDEAQRGSAEARAGLEAPSRFLHRRSAKHGIGG